MSDSKFSPGVAFLTMFKFVYFWLLWVHLGSHRGTLRVRTLPNMIFWIFFDSLMTSVRKRNGSRRSQTPVFDIIGHSLGAGVGAWYSAIFPEDVEKLILLDFVNIGPVTLEKHAKKAKESVLTGLKTFKKLSASAGQPEPTYDYIDAVAR